MALEMLLKIDVCTVTVLDTEPNYCSCVRYWKISKYTTYSEYILSDLLC